MQPKYQSNGPLRPSLPESSADWRFLLPITQNSRVLIIGGEQDDFTELFGKIGISEIIWLCGSLPAGGENHKNNGQSEFDAVESLTAQSFPPISFDIIAIPFGFPGRKLLDDVDVYQIVRSLLRPGGTMLIGFSNRFGLFRRRFQSNFYYSTPCRMIRNLRLAGYSQIDIFGAMQNLETPEYIFPLKTHLLSFTLQDRYRYKLPASLLYFLSNKPVVSILLYLLSYYFVIAKSDIETESDL